MGRVVQLSLEKHAWDVTPDPLWERLRFALAVGFPPSLAERWSPNVSALVAALVVPCPLCLLWVLCTIASPLVKGPEHQEASL